jgi:hypothetical protein
MVWRLAVRPSIIFIMYPWEKVGVEPVWQDEKLMPLADLIASLYLKSDTIDQVAGGVALEQPTERRRSQTRVFEHPSNIDAPRLTPIRSRCEG